MHSQDTDFLPEAELNSSDTMEMVLPNHVDFLPKVSVIIPCYNAEQYLRECLDSVINQTLKEIEVICIDDGSTDASLEIIREYQRQDNRIAIVVQENQKLGAARNNALKIAQGEYVQFLDSDDYIDLGTCENLYRKCKALDLDMLSYSGTNFDNATRELLGNPYYEFRYLPEDWDKEVFNYMDCISFLHRMAVSSCLTVYKRSFISALNLTFPVGLCFEDNVFFVKAITQAERVSIDTSLYYYRRIHSDSITQNWNKHFKDYLQIIELVLQYLKHADIDKQIFPLYRTAYLNVAKAIYKKFTCAEQEKYLGGLMLLINRYHQDSGAQEDSQVKHTVSEEEIGMMVDNLLGFYRKQVTQDFDTSVEKRLDTYRKRISQDVDTSTKAHLAAYREQISRDVDSSTEKHLAAYREQISQDVDSSTEKHLAAYRKRLGADIESRISSLRKSVDGDVKGTIGAQLDAIKVELEAHSSACKKYVNECVEKRLVAHRNATAQDVEKIIEEKLREHRESSIAYYEEKHRDGIGEIRQALQALEKSIIQSDVANRQLMVKKLQQESAILRRELKQSQELIRKTIRDFSQYSRYVRMCRWYKLLRYITFGKRRRHYKEKVRVLRQRIREIRDFVKVA